MSTWLHIVRDRRRRSQESQGGYLLLITLVVVGFLSIIVVALLGLLFADVSGRAVFARHERDRRAVDGALDIGIDRLKVSPAGQLGSNAGCAGLSGEDVVIEGRTVTLECDPETIDDPRIASPGAPGDGPVLTLLDNYIGQLDDGVNNSLGSVLGAAISGAATAIATYLTGGPGLIFFGPQPLQIVGDVKVRNSTVAKKDTAPSPAVSVTGNYRQGDAGLLGNLDLSWFGTPILTTPACGVLDKDVGSGADDVGLQLHATGTMQCGLGRDNPPPAAGSAMAAPAAFTETQRRNGTALPACVSNSVVTFSPGAYNRLQTAAMNIWFAGGNPACRDVTFHFPPGDYFFDVGGLYNDDRNALAFTDPTSNWVFGTPKGWSPGRATGANFPEACDPTQAGVSLTFSSRTAMKHRGGQVAICGTPGSSTKPVIYQEAGGTTQTWVGTASGASASPLPEFSTLKPFTNPAKATASVSPAPASFPAYGSAWNGSEATKQFATVSCNVGNNNWCAAIRLTGFADAAEPAPSGELTSAVLKIRGDAPDTADPFELGRSGDVGFRVIVYYGDGSNRACQVNGGEVPRNSSVDFVVDLKASCNDGNYSLTDATQLENATIEVHYALPSKFCLFGIGCKVPQARIDYAWLETSTTVAPSSSYSTVVNPGGGTSMNVFGPVYVPKSVLEVGWNGDAGTTPVFVGSVVARALGSIGLNGSVQVGVLAARKMVQPRRHVTIRAVLDGRLRGTAEVEITDSDLTGRVQSPGRLLEIVDWDLCNEDATAASC